MTTYQKIVRFISLISGIAFAIYLYRVFKDVPLNDDVFPLEAEKKAAEEEVSQVKEDLKDLEQKNYSDKEIEEKFNGKK
jgi:hypothetical protein